MRNKGKVHPFTSSSSPEKDKDLKDSPPLSVLNLLPAAIFTLVSVLSLQERQALAYMITRSLKSTTLMEDNKKKKQQSVINIDHSHGHNGGGLFHCDCFHCYTTFWFRWDSSPNRELIHQAIEAFEDHLNNGDHHHFKKNKRNGRRKVDEKMTAAGGPPENQDRPLVNNVMSMEHEVVTTAEAMELDAASPPTSAVVHNHKGLTRKILPDVMGIFNSRLWSLWSPNM